MEEPTRGYAPTRHTAPPTTATFATHQPTAKEELVERHDSNHDGLPMKEEHPESGYERRRSSFASRDDPFGDEENAEVKYRTMRWW